MISFYWIAYGIDLIIGDPYWFPHPIRAIGKLISFMENIIRKITSSPLGLKTGGVILTFTTVLITYFTTYFILAFVKDIHINLFYLINIVLLWTTIATKCLKEESSKVYNALKNKDILLGRKLLSYIVGRDTTHLNSSQITKAVIETIAENTSDGVVAPIFYMFIGGAPLALAYKAINTLDSMVGYKNEKYLYLGYASAKLDDIANFIPARITGIMLVIAAVILRLNMDQSLKILIRDRKNHSSPNCAYPEAAVAGALGVQLGGSHYYFGKLVHKPTIGDASREVEIENIIDTIKLMYVTSMLALLLFTFIHWFIY
ncbi:adenosylcobinamide-phosphate synthase CbiB [Serpentinicella alkaliphila]|uniref:Cobalamin biosynthesis protein CobD n=1 Tax=Serpentinicella alkaliphila TaxID=1734049 RepID=A0A4V2T477_9FIRM|nr:adenosylcobinamide-phosphate synthase CbiB [Serpentinicella alkaliphila]QUH24432.1 cobalamin biosynthesis protein [Serpentinicella alkaliphila]TCQ04174.1 adenosylcobinamide-phosphate synthase [Serpentinicella alkaliphila]